MLSPAAWLRCSGISFLAAVVAGTPLTAQGTTQLSWAAVAVYPHSDKWTFVGEVNPSSVVDGSPSWRELMVDVGAERTIRPGLDLVGYTYAIFTNQVEGLNTTEFRVRFGAQPFFRLRPRWFLQVRGVYEGRFIHYQGGETDFTQRARVRLFSRITIRQRNEYQPGAVYLRGDVEGYLPIGDKANERYFRVPTVAPRPDGARPGTAGVADHLRARPRQRRRDHRAALHPYLAEAHPRQAAPLSLSRSR